MVDRIRYPPYPIYHFIISFFQIDFLFLLLTIFYLQAKILAINDILSNLVHSQIKSEYSSSKPTIMGITLIPSLATCGNPLLATFLHPLNTATAITEIQGLVGPFSLLYQMFSNALLAIEETRNDGCLFSSSNCRLLNSSPRNLR